MTNQTIPAPSFSSDLTRKLVDDAAILTRFSGATETPGPQEENQVIDDLLAQYEKLDTGMRQELADLAALLTDEKGQEIRAAICRPGRAEIFISPDAMQVTVTLHRAEGGGKVLTTSDVIHLLKESGVVFGVDLPGLSNAVNEVSRGIHKLIRLSAAHGKCPVVGESGSVAVRIGELISQGASSKRQQWMVKQNELLAEIIPPTSGTPGTNVFGHEVPSEPGKEADITIGSGVLKIDSGAYVAEFDGLALYDGKRIELKRQLFWNDDLTVNDPPISFDGAVTVQGSVRDGASIRATGDIEIKEGIEGASVVSTNGSIIVRQGITGRGRGFVSAKKLLDAKYVENGIVYCEGDILVRHAVIHSRLTAGQGVVVELGKGAIFGGEIRAGHGIVAKSFGNAADIPTKLSVGHEWSSLQQLHHCELELASLRQAEAMCGELIVKFRRARPQLSSLLSNEKQALCDLLKRHMVLHTRIKQTEEQYQKLDGAWVLEGTGEIRCQDTIYAGVTVKMGGVTVLTTLNHNACSLKLSQEEKRILTVSSAGRKGYLG